MIEEPDAGDRSRRPDIVPMRQEIVAEKASGGWDRLFQEAAHCHKVGQLEQAEALYREILRSDSRHAGCLHLLGVIAMQRGDHEAAIELIRDALSVDDGYSEAHNNLGNALRGAGRLDEAEEQYRQALRIRPKYGEAHNNLGCLLRETGRPLEAASCYRKALEHTPLGHAKSAIYNLNLGAVLREAGQLDEAENAFMRALCIQPDSSSINQGLGLTLRDMGRMAEAERNFRRVVELNCNDPDANNNLGATLKALGQIDAAETHCRKALQLSPDHADAHTTLGAILLERGQLESAREHMERAVELAPDKAVYHFNLGSAKRYCDGDPQFAALESLLARIDTLKAQDQVYLQFALGKAYEDIGQWERAFEHLFAGNALKRRHVEYDERAVLERLRRIREIFTHEFMSKPWGAEVSGAADGPILIVGLPRSGSTLIEQILASHSQIFAAGEVNLLHRALTDTVGDIPYPDGVVGISAGDLRLFGARYASALMTEAPRAMRVTDKMLGNFLYCGLIHMAVPGVRIIHAKRDPVDTCLSCFSKLFVGQHPYAYDLAELGRYYSAYDTLMGHWHRTLPAGVLLEVDYESLVSDPECQIRRILAHCGLPWEEGCLSFHLNRRPVRTASAMQVRMPMYRSSVGRWRPNADLLRPLLDALEGRGAAG